MFISSKSDTFLCKGKVMSFRKQRRQSTLKLGGKKNQLPSCNKEKWSKQCRKISWIFYTGLSQIPGPHIYCDSHLTRLSSEVKLSSKWNRFSWAVYGNELPWVKDYCCSHLPRGKVDSLPKCQRVPFMRKGKRFSKHQISIYYRHVLFTMS